MRTKRQGRLTSGQIICMAAVATISGVAATTARADSFTYTGGTYTQNFDHLQVTAQTYSVTTTGPFNVPDDGNPSALTGWQYSRVAGSATKFTIDNGSGISGSAYSYGATGATERALGSLASRTSTPTIGIVIVNNSTDTYNALTPSFNGEQWAPGQRLALRWTDVDDGGSDDGLGIDNLSFAGSFVKNLVWNPGANRNWNTTDPNWLNGASSDTFVTNAVVNFTNTGVGSVIVDAAGVSP